MGKRFFAMNGEQFFDMMVAGAELLRSRADDVNALNVFPVPDGDTGTNMQMTVFAGIEELGRRRSNHLGRNAEVLSKGLLMGARGNSGVIMSQLFRGFAKSVQSYKEISPALFAAALQEGVNTAYKAVAKPVEGTILTVAKETARRVMVHSRRYQSIAELMEDALAQARQALGKTPDLLPALKQAGVVDAGGQGLVYIYEGFVRYLNGATDEAEPSPEGDNPSRQLQPPGREEAGKRVESASEQTGPVRAGIVQAQMATEQIEHPYDMEFFIRLSEGCRSGAPTFEPGYFRRELEKLGDSVIVIPDEDVVKVHIHSDKPGRVLDAAIKYGELTDIRILNMRDQHRELLADASGQKAKPQGVVTVAAGQGLADIFASVGADIVISGGQTMNPSTEQIVQAVRQVGAETVFVLPNNPNIILAAEQAKQLVEGRMVVIPSTTIPQGLAAMLAFNGQAEADENERAMTNATAHVKSGQVTYAVRDTTVDGIPIRQGDFLGIHDRRIVASEPDLLAVCRKLLDDMLQTDAEIITIIAGEDAISEQTERLVADLKQGYPDLDIEVRDGRQPLYYYIFSVE